MRFLSVLESQSLTRRSCEGVVMLIAMAELPGAGSVRSTALAHIRWYPRVTAGRRR